MMQTGEITVVVLYIQKVANFQLIVVLYFMLIVFLSDIIVVFFSIYKAGYILNCILIKLNIYFTY